MKVFQVWSDKTFFQRIASLPIFGCQAESETFEREPVWELIFYVAPIISLHWLIPHLEKLAKFLQSFSATFSVATLCLACSHPVRSLHWFHPARAAYRATIIECTLAHWLSASGRQPAAPETGFFPPAQETHQRHQSAPIIAFNLKPAPQMCHRLTFPQDKNFGWTSHMVKKSAYSQSAFTLVNPGFPNSLLIWLRVAEIILSFTCQAMSCHVIENKIWNFTTSTTCPHLNVGAIGSILKRCISFRLAGFEWTSLNLSELRLKCWKYAKRIEVQSGDIGNFQ